jgi:superfamily II DNA or RNA helicase
MKLILKDEQIPHVERLTKILENNFCAFDMSMMGAGKTYTSTALAKAFDFSKVIIICPASITSKWFQMKKYGLKIHDVISYESLRSIRGKDPAHKLLFRYDEGSKTYFEPSPQLERMAAEGLFVIFDEAQRVKNKNASWYACKSIAETVLLSGGMSRFLLLSGTPIDKQEHAINMMKMMGFIRSDKLFVHNYSQNTLNLYGAEELIEFCRRINSEKVSQILAEEAFTASNVEKICYKLFQKVIKLEITSSMPSPKNDEVHIDIKNAEYTIKNYQDEEALRKATNSVNEVFDRFRKIRYHPGEINPEENIKARELKEKRREDIQKKIEQIIHNMRIIENAKMNLFVELAKKKLSENPNYKVSLFVNYTSSIRFLQKHLAEYEPLVLDGKVPKEYRQDILNNFQAPTQKFRLLIGNIRVCSSGIDLDDKIGKMPRFVYANANLSILDLQQLPSRFLRLDTKSSTMFRFVYAKKYPEIGLLANLKKKSKVMKETTQKQTEEGIPFVGDLIMIDEDEME